MKPLVARNIEQLRPCKPGKPVEKTERGIGVKSPANMASKKNPL